MPWGLSHRWPSVTVACAMLSHVQLSATPWTVANQALLFIGFSQQEHWNGLPFPPIGDLPHPWIKLVSPVSPALACGFFTDEQPGKPIIEGSCSLIQQFTNLKNYWRSNSCQMLIPAHFTGNCSKPLVFGTCLPKSREKNKQTYESASQKIMGCCLRGRVLST